MGQYECSQQNLTAPTLQRDLNKLNKEQQASINPLIHQSINQTNQTDSHSQSIINQSINQSIHPSIHPSIHQSINQSVNQQVSTVLCLANISSIDILATVCRK